MAFKEATRDSFGDPMDRYVRRVVVQCSVFLRSGSSRAMIKYLCFSSEEP